jgi:hypothetical protein
MSGNKGIKLVSAVVAVAFGLFVLIGQAGAQVVVLTVGTAFDPGTLGNYALGFVGPYLLSIAGIILISSLVIGVYRKFGRFGRTLPNS